MTTRLKVYNGALALLGETPLLSDSEERSARYWLDRAWNDGLIDLCLQQGLWGFATRSQRLTPSTTIIPAFGYKYAYEMPIDFISLESLWTDEFFRIALIDYQIEVGIIYTNWNEIYIKFVSNDDTYGGNLARWPESFSQYVQAELASQVEPQISNSSSISAKIEKTVLKTRMRALNNDKQSKPLDMLPLGTWNRARNYGYRWGDRNCY